MKATSTIKNHKMFSQSDYDYLRRKGYNDAEILQIWDRDIQTRPWAEPVEHQPIPDVVSIICGN